MTKKAVEFAEYVGADVEIVEASALTHDLNYIVKPNSEPEVAQEMRAQYLSQSSFNEQELERIEGVIMESHMRTRNAHISNEGKALSDADTLFKALPTTPILFASKYITQNKVDIYKLADKVTGEQNALMESGIYFYIDKVNDKYLPWARTNLAMWNKVKESLSDEDVIEMLDNAKRLGVI